MPVEVSLSDRQPASGHRQHAAAASAGAAAETTVTCGSGSVVLPVGIMNPSVPIRNIKTKFAVLTGLIQVGQVGNRDIVETVLNLVSLPFKTPRMSPRMS
ncbi:Neurobeachin Lysosomal-trafficking regulator 2 [Takifugu flavidus]|uniref:Neurobeachin Lysosomal-trafficking regulator 2 n=1 Tax=Takifugu flavidus TaxID=433684 RepID=A0A5C6PD71_9TELE|nr:Neurobeachin Lysosomal-trafficking regulator 2 [Takifugu flavidus]